MAFSYDYFKELEYYDSSIVRLVMGRASRPVFFEDRIGTGYREPRVEAGRS